MFEDQPRISDESVLKEITVAVKCLASRRHENYVLITALANCNLYTKIAVKKQHGSTVVTSVQALPEDDLEKHGVSLSGVSHIDLDSLGIPFEE